MRSSSLKPLRVFGGRALKLAGSSRPPRCELRPRRNSASTAEPSHAGGASLPRSNITGPIDPTNTGLPQNCSTRAFGRRRCIFATALRAVPDQTTAADRAAAMDAEGRNLVTLLLCGESWTWRGTSGRAAGKPSRASRVRCRPKRSAPAVRDMARAPFAFAQRRPIGSTRISSFRRIQRPFLQCRLGWGIAGLALAADAETMSGSGKRRCGREAEGGGLLNRYRVVKPYRGFESLRLRQRCGSR